MNSKTTFFRKPPSGPVRKMPARLAMPKRQTVRDLADKRKFNLAMLFASCDDVASHSRYGLPKLVTMMQLVVKKCSSQT